MREMMVEEPFKLEETDKKGDGGEIVEEEQKEEEELNIVREMGEENQQKICQEQISFGGSEIDAGKGGLFETKVVSKA